MLANFYQFGRRCSVKVSMCSVVTATLLRMDQLDVSSTYKDRPNDKVHHILGRLEGDAYRPDSQVFPHKVHHIWHAQDQFKR